MQEKSAVDFATAVVQKNTEIFLGKKVIIQIAQNKIFQ